MSVVFLEVNWEYIFSKQTDVYMKPSGLKVLAQSLLLQIVTTSQTSGIPIPFFSSEFV